MWGRLDDLMSILGYRVSPVEIEQLFLTHPSIEEIAILPVEVKPDVTLIGAFIQCKKLRPLPARSIGTICIR